MIARENEPIRFHKMATARHATGISLQTIARRLGISMAKIRTTETETRDAWVSDLHVMSHALGVPVQDLLATSSYHPKVGILDISQLSDISKTIDELDKVVENDQDRAMVEMLRTQLCELKSAREEGE